MLHHRSPSGWIARRHQKILVAVAAVHWGLSPAARAATKTWVAGSANWNTPANWSPAGDPAAGDVVNLFNGAAPFPVITYDGSGAPAGALSPIVIDGTNVGFVTLSQTGGALTSGIEYVGNNGTALLSVSGGTHTVGTELYVAFNPGSKGTVNQSAGLVSVGTLLLADDTNANATYNQSGGTATVNVLYMAGARTTASGTYNLSGPSTTLNLTAGAQVGLAGFGAFNQSGGVVNVTGGSFQLATAIGATGAYTLSGGTFNAPNRSLAVGAVGTGTMTQTGGAVNVGFLTVSGFGTTSNASVGTYNLSGSASTVNVSQVESVAFYGTGTFNQIDGVNAIADGLTIAANVGAVGNYNLYGGTINCAGGDLIIGGTVGGVGTFSQSAGAATFFDAAIGYSPSPAVVNLTGGAFKALGALTVGIYGNGTFNQTGGLLTADSLTLSDMPLSTGAFNLGGGTLHVGTESVGGTSSATFVQTGGTHNVAGMLTVADGGPATFALSGGTLTAANELIGHAATGTFTQSGGTHTVTGTLSVSTIGGGAGSYTLLNGSLTANAVVVNPNGVFNQFGGSLFATAFTLAGGTVNGTLQNLGVFTYGGGNFTGRLVNLGTINPGTSFTLGNGIENDATFVIPTGSVVTVNGAGLDNLGALTLQPGATLGGSGPLLNDFGGVMNAAGLVTGAFVNDGELDVTGLLTLANPTSNFGVINVPAADNLRHAGLTNSGTINLSGGSLSGPAAVVTNSPSGSITGGGAISALANNGGLVYANGTSPLVIATLTANNNGGELRVANSSTLTVSNAFTSAGVITLQGTGAAFNGGALTNTGTIAGAGRLSNALVNTGIVRAVAGQLTFSAAGILNTGPGQIQATTGNTVSFTQGLANAATISLGGGTVDTGSALLSNTGQLLGNGVISTGGLLNSGTVSLADVASSVYGPVTNNGSLKVTSNTTTFYGPVTNNGNLKTTAAVARFLAPFTNNGTYVSDPSAQFFGDLTVGPAGALVGGAGDRFTLTGDFHSTSAARAAWQTAAAALAFTGGGASTTHAIDVTGADHAGYDDNFAWGAVELGQGQSLLLRDGDATPGGALYAAIVTLDAAPAGDALPAFIAAHLLNADPADALNLYYDPTQPANGYLAGDAYPLGNGGVLAPAVATPEPASLAAWLALATCVPGVRRRRRAPQGP